MKKIINPINKKDFRVLDGVVMAACKHEVKQITDIECVLCGRQLLGVARIDYKASSEAGNVKEETKECTCRRLDNGLLVSDGKCPVHNGNKQDLFDTNRDAYFKAKQKCTCTLHSDGTVVCPVHYPKQECTCKTGARHCGLCLKPYAFKGDEHIMDTIEHPKQDTLWEDDFVEQLKKPKSLFSDKEQWLVQYVKALLKSERESVIEEVKNSFIGKKSGFTDKEAPYRKFSKEWEAFYKGWTQAFQKMFNELELKEKD